MKNTSKKNISMMHKRSMVTSRLSPKAFTSKVKGGKIGNETFGTLYYVYKNGTTKYGSTGRDTQLKPGYGEGG